MFAQSHLHFQSLMRVQFLALFVTLFAFGIAQGQEITIELGPDEIGLNQVFTITVSVKNDRLKEYSNFPEISGLDKRGTSSSSSTNIINGQITTSQSITMNYVPRQEGTIVIQAFKMEVNGVEVSSPGKTLKIGPAIQRQPRTDPFGRDPFDDLFGRRSQPKEFVDVEEDAFLALTVDKEEVFLGEGFTTTLAFYVSETNRAPLQFYDLGRQVSDIVKTLKPANCWEENFNIENIAGEPINIGSKQYTQYKVYQASFFPLNLEPIYFPQVGLELIKYKVARNPSFFGQNRQEDYKTFYSKPRSVVVKELPPHPLMDLVTVGNFRLEETLDKKVVETGQSFSYNFRVYGEGNISSINMMPLPASTDFEFYEPNIQQKINRRNDRVTGSKNFNYYGIPNEPGVYKLGDYFSWIYFNTSNEEYDTLKSSLSIRATGESRKNQQILSNDLGAFYDRLELEDNQLQARARSSLYSIFANVAILLMLVGAGFIAFRKIS